MRRFGSRLFVRAEDTERRLVASHWGLILVAGLTVTDKTLSTVASLVAAMVTRLLVAPGAHTGCAGARIATHCKAPKLKMATGFAIAGTLAWQCRSPA